MMVMKAMVSIILSILLLATALYGAVIRDKETFVYQTPSSDSIRDLREINGDIYLFGFSNSTKGNGRNDYKLVRVGSSGSVTKEAYYGGSGDDRGYVLASNGQRIVAGGASISSNGDRTNFNGLWDAWILELNSNLEIVEEKSYGGEDNETLRDLIFTIDGGKLFCGYTFSEDLDNYHDGKDFWLVKISTFGELEWQKVYGGTGYDMPYSVVQTRDGGFVVTGYSFSVNGELKGMDNHGNGDYWVLKLDRNGNIEWSKLYGGSGWDEPRVVLETYDRGYLIAGVTSSHDGDVSDHQGRWDAWVIKLDRSGELEWENTYGGSGLDKVFSAVETRDKRYVLAGFTTSDDGDVSHNEGNADAWVFKLNRNGDLLWETTFGGKESECAEKIIELENGKLALAWGKFTGSVEYAGDGGRRYENFILTTFRAF